MLTPKELRPCCAALSDNLGRLQPGFCSPGCIGRVERDAMLAAQAATPGHHRPYSLAERAEAVAYAVLHGATAAAERFGMARSTLYEWRWMAS